MSAQGVFAIFCGICLLGFVVFAARCVRDWIRQAEREKREREREEGE